MERWLAKLIGLILTFLLPFIFTVIPHHMIACIDRHGNRGRRVLSLLMCFGGGIFLATYLLHMGPEVSLTRLSFCDDFCKADVYYRLSYLG